MPNIISTHFDSVELSIIDYNHQKWLTAEQVGLALGYEKTNARKGIIKLYQRHNEEFTAQDSTVVNLTTVDNKRRDVRVFSSSGCHLLSFFSNTPRAKQFRAWAKEALKGQPTPALGVDERLARLEGAVVNMAGHMHNLVKVSEQQAEKLEVTGRYIGLLEINQKGKVRVTRKKEAQVLALRAQGMSMTDISAVLRISRTSVSQLVNNKYPWAESEKHLPKESIESILDDMVGEERQRVQRKLRAMQTPVDKPRMKVEG